MLVAVVRHNFYFLKAGRTQQLAQHKFSQPSSQQQSEVFGGAPSLQPGCCDSHQPPAATSIKACVIEAFHPQQTLSLS